MPTKRLALILLALIIFAIAASVFLMTPDTSAPSPSNNSQNSNSQSQNTSNQSPSTNQTGNYVAYNASVVESDSGQKILFFHAPWCSQCRQLDTDIKANNVPSGTTIYKVDYDSNQALRQKYGVTLQTTFVKIDNEGKLVKKYVAYEEPTFKSLQENIL